MKAKKNPWVETETANRRGQCQPEVDARVVVPEMQLMAAFAVPPDLQGCGWAPGAEEVRASVTLS